MLIKQLEKTPTHEPTTRSLAVEIGHLRTLTRAGATIHFWSTGAPEAPAVICTHGVTLDHGTFAGQVAPLDDTGYRVITWDLRGHGLSRPSRAFPSQR